MESAKLKRKSVRKRIDLDRAGFFDKVDIPKYIKLLSLVYLIFIGLNLLVYFSPYNTSAKDFSRIASHLLTVVGDCALALTFWGVGQFLTIFRIKK